MRRTKLGRKIAGCLVCLIATAMFVVACDGSGATGETELKLGTSFESDGGAGGTITISVSGPLTVAGTVGFSVALKDASGAPLAFVDVFCDSEDGVAILEPSSGGVALGRTDGFGSMSGEIGGVTPGSYTMSCRGPQGFGLVADVAVKVTGDVPEGFVGFPGAAGGNLGGGTIVIPGDIGVTSVTFGNSVDGFSEGGPLDATFTSDCDDAPDSATDDEPFNQDSYIVTLFNDNLFSIYIDTIEVIVDGGLEDETYTVAGEITAGATGTVSGALGVPSGTSKSVLGEASSWTVGGHSVEFIVTGTTATGVGFSFSTTKIITYADQNNCA